MSIEGFAVRSVISRGATRDDVARVYAQLLAEDIDWEDVNGAILERWSESGLAYIKSEAWKLALAAEEAPK